MTLEEKILYPKKSKAIFGLVLPLLLTAVGIWMVLYKNAILGWIATIFFGLGVVIAFINLLPNASYLKLYKDGFEFCTMYKKDRYNWDDIQSFSTGTANFKTMVTFNFAESFQKYKTMRKVSAKIGGKEGALPDTYGLTANELAYLMNEYKHTYSTN